MYMWCEYSWIQDQLIVLYYIELEHEIYLQSTQYQLDLLNEAFNNLGDAIMSEINKAITQLKTLYPIKY